MLWKCCMQHASKFGKLSSGHRTGKVSFHWISKNVQTTVQLHSFHMLAWSCSKSPKLGFNSITENFQMYKLDLERAEEPEIQLPTSLDHRKSKRVPEKHLLPLHWLCQSLWLCGSQETVGNSSRDGNTRPPDLPPEKSVWRSSSNRYNRTWNRLVQNWERSVSRLHTVTLFI